MIEVGHLFDMLNPNSTEDCRETAIGELNRMAEDVGYSSVWLPLLRHECWPAVLAAVGKAKASHLQDIS